MKAHVTRPQAVYFDSNILIGAGWPFPTAQLLETVRIAKAADLDVCLPDLVLREVTAHWLRDLQSARQNLADQVKAFNRDTFGLSDMASPLKLPRSEELLARYTKCTKELTDMFRIVPTKDRPASYYTKLALRRHGAFGEKGKGFHDTIILIGILEDMDERQYHHAIIVSKDGGFRLDGVKRLAAAANVEFTVFESLAALEKPVKEELSAKVVREMKAAKQRVIDLVKTRQTSLIDFLSKALDYTRDPLGAVFNTVSRREFVSFIDYDNAHSSTMLFKLEPLKDFKFSVNVRVRVRETSEEFRVSDPLSGFSASSLFQVVHPENTVSKTIEREMAVTVEGEADLSDQGVETIRFTAIHDLQTGGFAALTPGS